MLEPHCHNWGFGFLNDTEIEFPHALIADMQPSVVQPELSVSRQVGTSELIQ